MGNLNFKSWKLSIIYASGKTLEDLQILTLSPILIRGKCTKINLNVSTNYFWSTQIDRCNQKQISFLDCPLKIPMKNAQKAIFNCTQIWRVNVGGVFVGNVCTIQGCRKVWKSGGTVCSNGFYADIWSQHQMQKYQLCLKSFLWNFCSFEVP